MKQLFSSLPAWVVTLAFVLPCVTATAEDTPPYDPSKLKKLFPIKNGEAYPHSPSRVYIECTYTTGSLTFVLPPSIYSTTVDLSNDWYSWSGFVTRDQPTLEIPDLEGTYTIRCNADDGKTYIGTIDF